MSRMLIDIGATEAAYAFDPTEKYSDGTTQQGIRIRSDPDDPGSLTYDPDHVVRFADLPAATAHALGDHTDTNLGAPVNHDVVYWDSATSKWICGPVSGAGGEANTASNQGVGGVGVFDAKVGVDLQFRNVNAADSAISVALDSGNKEIDIGLVQANIDHTAIANIGTNSHAAIDTHIADGTKHFLEGSIDHTNILNIGTNTHAQIDTHIADSTIHFTDTFVDVDGTDALTGDWDIGDGRMIQADKIRARDGDGLALYEDGGDGLFIADGGDGYWREAEANRNWFLQVFSTTTTHFPHLYLDKSAAGGIGTMLETDNGEYLGGIYFRGCDSANNQDCGAVMYARQDGAASTYVPTNLFLYTFSGTGVNSNQLVLHNDGHIGLGTDSPGARLEVETGTTEGHEAAIIDQNDLDQTALGIEFATSGATGAFIAITGTVDDSEPPTSGNLTTMSGVWIEAGHIKILVGGNTYWLPYDEYSP